MNVESMGINFTEQYQFWNEWDPKLSTKTFLGKEGLQVCIYVPPKKMDVLVYATLKPKEPGQMVLLILLMHVQL